MKKIFLFTLSLILLCSWSLAEAPRDYKKTSLSYNIFNAHIVAPNIMRSAQPSEGDFKILKDYYNVKTILNLRDNKEHNQWERKVIEKLGMKYINIPMSGRKKQSIEKIEKCLAIINSQSNKPILVHCHAGKDRTGLVCAAYRIKYDNWSFEDAFIEMLAYGYDQARCFILKESLSEWNAWKK